PPKSIIFPYSSLFRSLAMYLGLDLGTSSLKAILVDEEQRLLAEAHAPLSVARPHPGWSEQDPSSWISAAEAALTALAQQHSLSEDRKSTRLNSSHVKS